MRETADVFSVTGIRQYTLDSLISGQQGENSKDDMIWTRFLHLMTEVSFIFSSRVLSSSFDVKSRKKIACIVLGASWNPVTTTGMELPNPWHFSYCLIYCFCMEHYSPTMPSFKLFQVVYFRKPVLHFLYGFSNIGGVTQPSSLPYLCLVYLLIFDPHYTLL